MSDINILSEGLNLTDEQRSALENNLAVLRKEKLLATADDVARAEGGLLFTRAGFDVLAKAIAGGELRYSRVAFGDALKSGNVVIPTDEDIADMTALIHKKNINLPLVDVSFSGGGTATVSFQVQNQTLSEGFHCREIGLFAFDPDTNDEVLYAYKNYGNLGKWIPAGGSAVHLNLVINLVTVVGQAQNVTAVVDASLLYVTQADLQAHINSSRPHPNVPNVAAVIHSSDYFWAQGADNQLHPISADDLQAQLVGDLAVELPHVSSRLSQAETNVANLFTQLKSQLDTDLNANLLIAEDFIDCEFCDLFKVKVTSIPQTNVLNVESLDGLREGLTYTITDGIRSESVQITGSARAGSTLSVTLAEPLAKTYASGKTWLYRSTGVAVDEHFGGAGDMRSSAFDFSSFVWKGESSSSTRTLTLATTLKNSKKFDLTGDGTFADGFFTLA